MEYDFTLNDRTYKVFIEKKKEALEVKVEDRIHRVDCHPVSPNCLSLLIDQKAHLVYVAEEGGRKHISLHGHDYVLEEVDERAGREAGGAAGDSALHDGLIKTPMPGRIVKVLVSENDRVESGQNLVIIESMKMENNIKAPADGVVQKVFVSPGDSTRFGETVIQLEISS